MGAYWPAPFATPQLMDEVMRKIVMPTVKAFSTRGGVQGVLSAGLMIAQEGPAGGRVQHPLRRSRNEPVMMRLKSDIVPAVINCANGWLELLRPGRDWTRRRSR